MRGEEKLPLVILIGGGWKVQMNIIAHLLSSFVFGLKTFLSNFTPAPEFLSDVAAFEAVVIALAVPLSFEIVSRISERYQSEVITKQFIQEWEIKWLPIFLMINIILAVALRFFVQDNSSSGLWAIYAWIALAGFLFIAVILLKFIRKLKIYMTDTEQVLDKFYQNAEKLFE
jgi:hypothetical protein